MKTNSSATSLADLADSVASSKKIPLVEAQSLVMTLAGLAGNVASQAVEKELDRHAEGPSRTNAEDGMLRLVSGLSGLAAAVSALEESSTRAHVAEAFAKAGLSIRGNQQLRDALRSILRSAG
jgi:hypothetical protein